MTYDKVWDAKTASEEGYEHGGKLVPVVDVERQVLRNRIENNSRL